MKQDNKPYFYQSAATVILAAASFVVFKQFLPSKIFPETAVASKNVVIDSMLLDAIEADKEELVSTTEMDSINAETISFDAVEGISFPNENFENYQGFQHLIPFYEKLFQLETQQKGRVRIGYFGDSMTDGDMIVQDVRSQFQKQFGGLGVGIVPISSESALSRNSITQTFSDDWQMQSFVNVKKPRAPFGITGRVFFQKDSISKPWVQYKASKQAFISALNQPTLFYGKSANLNGKMAIVVGKDTIKQKLNPSQWVNTAVINNKSLQQFKAIFSNAQNIPFYAFNFDDGKGVHVDNFSTRGNSGLPILNFKKEVLQQFNKYLNYDLIVLHYGTNVLNYGSLNYTWYEKRMKRVVNHLKDCFPGVSILVVSTADKSSKYDLEMKTDSAVVPLTLAQKKYAIQSESGFINLYTLMGGNGSMVKWVEEVPAKANKDYTHFTHRGAKQIASLLYKNMFDGYEKYKKMRLSVPKKKVVKDSIASPKKDSAYVE